MIKFKILYKNPLWKRILCLFLIPEWETLEKNKIKSGRKTKIEIID